MAEQQEDAPLDDPEATVVRPAGILITGSHVTVGIDGTVTQSGGPLPAPPEEIYVPELDLPEYIRSGPHSGIISLRNDEVPPVPMASAVPTIDEAILFAGLGAHDFAMTPEQLAEAQAEALAAGDPGDDALTLDLPPQGPNVSGIIRLIPEPDDRSPEDPANVEP